MKKPRILVLSLAVAVMAMGAGYAAWTDKVDIVNTVQTGQLDVAFEDRGEAVELKLADYTRGEVNYERNWNDTGASADQNNWDVAKVNFSNLYPGAHVDVSLKIKNNSTIPIEMRAITDTRSDNWGPNGDNFNQIGATARFFDKDNKPLEFDNDTTYANPWEPAHLKDVELPVGGYATIEFNFTASDTIDENATYTFSPTAVFQQFNAGPGGVALEVQSKAYGDQK